MSAFGGKADVAFLELNVRLIVSTGVTVHFLFGAIVVANLPRLYKSFGVATVTKVGSVALATGITGWALAREPWQFFAATLLSGGGWVTMGAGAVNAIIAPWFARTRPMALSSAYNGSSVGGIVFSPLWVASIGLLGFPTASLVIGTAMIVTIWILSDAYYSKTPDKMGLNADGDVCGFVVGSVTLSSARPLPGKQRGWIGGSSRLPLVWRSACSRKLDCLLTYSRFSCRLSAPRSRGSRQVLPPPPP